MPVESDFVTKEIAFNSSGPPNLAIHMQLTVAECDYGNILATCLRYFGETEDGKVRSVHNTSAQALASCFVEFWRVVVTGQEPGFIATLLLTQVGQG